MCYKYYNVNIYFAVKLDKLLNTDLFIITTQTVLPKNSTKYFTLQRNSLLMQLLDKNMNFALGGINMLNLKATGRVSNILY